MEYVQARQRNVRFDVTFSKRRNAREHGDSNHSAVEHVYEDVVQHPLEWGRKAGLTEVGLRMDDAAGPAI
jgi:hypothetical protein